MGRALEGLHLVVQRAQLVPHHAQVGRHLAPGLEGAVQAGVELGERAVGGLPQRRPVDLGCQGALQAARLNGQRLKGKHTQGAREGEEGGRVCEI